MSRYTPLVAAFLVLAGCSSNGSDVTQPTTGGVAVTLTTTGAEPDPDGYLLSIDGGQGIAINDNASYTAIGLAVGSHTAGLSGLAANCTVQGGNPQTFTVVAGDTVQLSATVNCPATTPTTGRIQVRTRKTGTGNDENGYTIKLDNNPRVPISPFTDDFFFENVTPGTHTVDLDGLASFCTLNPGSSNPITVNVDPGETVIATFRTTCVAPEPPAARAAGR